MNNIFENLHCLNHDFDKIKKINRIKNTPSQKNSVQLCEPSVVLCETRKSHRVTRRRHRDTQRNNLANPENLVKIKVQNNNKSKIVNLKSKI